jgi:transposase InsO family protein
VSDLTYIKIRKCFVYLAVILDLHSRQVIGWALSRNLDHGVCVAALTMAITERQPSPFCIHHSDHGVQYTSEEYDSILAECQLRPSAGTH